jgi:hypothetical protein
MHVRVWADPRAQCGRRGDGPETYLPFLQRQTFQRAATVHTRAQPLIYIWVPGISFESKGGWYVELVLHVSQPPGAIRECPGIAVPLYISLPPLLFQIRIWDYKFILFFSSLFHCLGISLNKSFIIWIIRNGRMHPPWKLHIRTSVSPTCCRVSMRWPIQSHYRHKKISVKILISGDRASWIMNVNK